MRKFGDDVWKQSIKTIVMVSFAWNQRRDMVRAVIYGEGNSMGLYSCRSVSVTQGIDIGVLWMSIFVYLWKWMGETGWEYINHLWVPCLIVSSGETQQESDIGRGGIGKEVNLDWLVYGVDALIQKCLQVRCKYPAVPLHKF